MEFSPANNVIRVRTYSPWLDLYEADADSSSQFTLAYPMTAPAPFQALGSATVPSGSVASWAWSGLEPRTQYEWYAVASDSSIATTGPTWGFTTTSALGVAVPPTTSLQLSAVTPNPAVNDFRIGFALPREAPVRITLLDLQGREVATLAEARFPAGRNSVACNRARGPLHSGVYFVRLEALGASLVRRLVLVH